MLTYIRVHANMNPSVGVLTMNTNYRELSDLDVLRMAERECGEAIAAFFRKIFTKRDAKDTKYNGHVVAAE